jgi:hypothetical protein
MNLSTHTGLSGRAVGWPCRGTNSEQRKETGVESRCLGASGKKSRALDQWTVFHHQNIRLRQCEWIPADNAWVKTMLSYKHTMFGEIKSRTLTNA